MMKEIKIKVNDNISLLVSLSEEASLDTFAGITTYINALRRVDAKAEEVSPQVSEGKKKFPMSRERMPSEVMKAIEENLEKTPKITFKELKKAIVVPEGIDDIKLKRCFWGKRSYMNTKVRK